MTAPRIVNDPDIYGIEFSYFDGELHWRHNAEKVPHSTTPYWRVLTKVVDGWQVFELGCTPRRMRLWADLLERPNESGRFFAPNSPETPVAFAASTGARSAK